MGIYVVYTHMPHGRMVIIQYCPWDRNGPVVLFMKLCIQASCNRCVITNVYVVYNKCDTTEKPEIRTSNRFSELLRSRNSELFSREPCGVYDVNIRDIL